jgi:hypothetical protein
MVLEDFCCTTQALWLAFDFPPSEISFEVIFGFLVLARAIRTRIDYKRGLSKWGRIRNRNAVPWKDRQLSPPRPSGS